ncbi:hypothetical protein Q8A73_014484 [Channa argus]|nr:hypothetical protein Q8A73_014484 [Channa argus]
MYPSLKEKDSAHSGTGVYYQAIPAVGSDGKKIMKLIPVQMVNGQFFRTDLNKLRTDSTAQKDLTANTASAPIHVVKKAALNYIPPQQIVKKQVSCVNTTSNQVELDHGYSLNNRSLQQQAVCLPDKVPKIATPATNCGSSVRHPCQPQVTVKSPSLSKGHRLLDAPNTQIQTFPTYELSEVVKKPTFNLSGNSSTRSNSPSRANLSPATTVNQGVTPPTNSAFDSLKLFCDTSNKAQCAARSKGSKPHLKLIPKASQRPNSPIKWVIEEEETPGKDFDIVKTTPFCSSNVLQSVVDRETSRKGSDVTEETLPQSVLGKSGQGQENAHVVCNGKVFYLSKKCNVQFKKGQSDSPTSVTKSSKSNRTTVPSSKQSVKPVVTPTRPDLRIIIPDDSDDVIDLCDEDDSTPLAASVDEDNVIFVSYIPPKSESGSAKDMMLKTQTALEKETDKTDASNSNCVTKDKSGRAGGDDEDRDRGLALRGKQPGQSIFSSSVVNVPHVTNLHGDSNIKSHQNSPSQQVESLKVDVETQSPADTSTLDSSSGTSPKVKDTDQMHSSPNPACWTSLLPPKPCQMADHVLRQMFGVTADVKICLRRVDDTSVWPVLTQPLQIECIGPVEHHQEATNTLQDLYGSCKKQKMDNSMGLINVRRVRLRNELESSTSHTDIRIDNKCHSGHNSLYGTSCDVRTAAEIGYVEPIDEDFSSTDENEVHNSYDATAQPQSQTCVDMKTKTRIGRTRKQTMCPCCTPGPAVKSTVRLEEMERGAWTAEQMSKKEGRAKAPGKDGPPSGKISCLKAKNKHKHKTDVAASNSLTTTSMDADELKHEQIKKTLRPSERERCSFRTDEKRY